MSTQILAHVMNDIGKVFNKIPGNLEGTALWLLYIFTTIDLGLMIFKVDEVDWIKTICRKAFKVGIFTYIITHYKDGLYLITKSFIAVGNKAINIFGDDGAELVQNPSKLMDKVISLTDPLTPKITVFSGAGWLYLVLTVAIIFAGVAIGFQIFVTWLEFYALTGITIIFIPFAMIEKTAFLAEKAIGIIVALAIKLMMLSMIIGASASILMGLKFSPKATIQEVIHVLSIVASITYLICRVPSLAASMMTGNPSLTSGDMAGMIRGGSTAVGAAVGTVAGGAINTALGMTGKGSLGQMFGGGKAHTAGQAMGAMGRRLGRGASALKSRLSGSSGGSGSPTAPGGKENSHAHQSSKGSDSGNASEGGGSKGSSANGDSSNSPKPGSGNNNIQGNDSQTPSDSNNSPGGSQESNTSFDTGTQQNDKESKTSPGSASISSTDNSSSGRTSKSDTGTKQNSKKSNSPGGSQNNQSGTSKVQLSGRTYNMPKDTGKKVNGREIPTIPGEKE